MKPLAVAVVTAQAVAVTTSHAHPGPRAALPESLWPTSAIEEWTAAALTDLCASTCVKFNEAVVPWSRWKGIREAAHAPSDRRLTPQRPGAVENFTTFDGFA